MESCIDLLNYPAGWTKSGHKTFFTQCVFSLYSQCDLALKNTKTETSLVARPTGFGNQIK